MGRKKGKQGGQSGYKSKHAAIQSDINQIVSEHRHYSTRKNGDAWSSVDNTKPLSSSRPRITANVNQLRGLIRERVMEDRLRDANYRRATANPPSRRIEEEDIKITEEITLMDPGWMIDYNHQEAMAGIEPRKNEMSLCSLDTLSMRSLAPVLNEYIVACGCECIHERISTLPSHVISSLSVICKNVTDDTAYVLGSHTHIDRLVLNASPRDLYHSDDIEDDASANTTEERLTTKGLLAMALLHAPSFIEEEGDSQQNVVIDSWEDVNLHQEYERSPDEWNLRRLELRNFNAETAIEFVGFLRQCSMLTHMSLGKSLNSITGPQVLLWNSLDNLDESSSGTMNGCTKTLLDVLPRLKILDLSGCLWLHFDLLKLFLKRVMLQSTQRNGDSCQKNTTVALEMIFVGGCCKYLSRQCENLNKVTGRRPLVCIRPL